MWKSLFNDTYELIRVWWSHDRIRASCRLSQIASLEQGDIVLYQDLVFKVRQVDRLYESESLGVRVLRLEIAECPNDEGLHARSLSFGLVAVIDSETRFKAFVSDRTDVDWFQLGEACVGPSSLEPLDSSMEGIELLVIEDVWVLPKRTTG